MIPRFKPYLGKEEFSSIFKNHRNAIPRFEKAFAAKFNVEDAIAFPYGRSAQWAFFKANGIEGAEILMPAYTCSVVAHAVKLSGNEPVFVDIKLSDYNMDLDQLASKVTSKTRAIIATHTFGYPQDIDRLESIASEASRKFGHKVWLMQDCCHAFGAQWKGRDIHSSGGVAVFAFNISKMITSVFGGMVTFQDNVQAKRMRAFRDAIYNNSNVWKDLTRRLYLFAVCLAFNPSIYGMVWWLQEKTSVLSRFTDSFHLEDKIQFPPDYLTKMTEFEAIIGDMQIKKYDRIIKKRRDMAFWYDRNLSRRDGWRFPQIVDGATYSHYTVAVPDRYKVIHEYARKGIELGSLIQYCIPALKSYGQNKYDFPKSVEASLNTINFPVSLNIEDIQSRLLQ